MHTLTTEQRDALAAELERSREALLATARELTPEQLAWKPAPDSWSVAECLEHVAVVEGMLAGRLERMAAAAPSDEGAKSVEGKDERVVTVARNREAKRQAPDMARPQGRFTTLAEFEAHFIPLRNANITFVRTTEAPLHALIEPHPALGDMSAHQWLWFLSAHCDRHAEQAREVRANPKFPPSDVPS